MKHYCAVITCGQPSQTIFIAAEDGELAGWTVKKGDEVRFCWAHARAIYQDRDPLWDGALG